MSRSVLLAALVALALLAVRRRRRPGGQDHPPGDDRPGGRLGLRRRCAPRPRRGVRRAPRHPARAAGRGRERRRRSLLFFAQLTDPQIADEMSPARVDFADPGGGELKSSWRPQEALGTQTFDSVVRNVNANARSQVRQGDGRRAKLGARHHDRRPRRQPAAQRDALVQDGARRRQGRSVLGQAGRRGQPLRRRRRRRSPGSNADVAARRYTGVAGLRRLPRRPGRSLRRLLRPRRGPADRHGPVRRVPALPRAARTRPAAVHRRRPRRAVVHLPGQPRRARPGQRTRQRGPLPLDRHRVPEGVPERGVRSRRLRGLLRGPALQVVRRPGVHRLAARGRGQDGSRPRPPAGRQGGVQAADRHERGAHGFGYVDATENRRSGGTASYYAWSPAARRALRLARHGRRGRRPERQPRRRAVSLARPRPGAGPPARRARRRLRAPHARHHGQRAPRRARGRVHDARRAGVRSRSAPLDAASSRGGGPQDGRRPAPAPPRGRLRGGPHALQPRATSCAGVAARSGRSTPLPTSTGPSRAG